MNATEPLHAAFGPAPFAFTPTVSPQAVAAFTRPFRVLAWLLLGGLALWMLQSPETWLTPIALWGVLAWLLMAATVWAIERSRTTLTQEGLLQTWLWDKKMDMRELAFARLIRLRGFDWLIAPRLYVRNLSGKFTVIYCANPAMLEDMQRLCTELHHFRTSHM
ncbi:hypothetical protein [Limnohabitans radicicola]|uniref:Uncharacterized protein n=1 Tax=Limnohabitans radicicola TaxID=2771427 RepID=A0A927FHP8_9BURK|nr:hypothetical protein [Limnohabitans radicicola]MBD8051689.1 hypothetical protein [Limnohabitans radicicola]